MSSWSFVSPVTRLDAADMKATNRPVALIEGKKLPSLAWTPAVDTLTRVT
jgi:hypothetical protein